MMLIENRISVTITDLNLEDPYLSINIIIRLIHLSLRSETVGRREACEWDGCCKENNAHHVRSPKAPVSITQAPDRLLMMGVRQGIVMETQSNIMLFHVKSKGIIENTTEFPSLRCRIRLTLCISPSFHRSSIAWFGPVGIQKKDWDWRFPAYSSPLPWAFSQQNPTLGLEI